MAEAPEPASPSPGLTSILWPNGALTPVPPGTEWLEAARQARCPIPTGCLGGSCGACEITVNGETLRACLALVPASEDLLAVEPWDDPFW